MFSGKTISTALDSLGRRLIKFTGAGKTDLKNIVEATPWGLDSNVPPKVIAIYEAVNEVQNVCIGYIVVNKKADVGETRLFSTDNDGNLQGWIWLKNDGKVVIRQGSSPAVLGDKNVTALNDASQTLADIKVALVALQTAITAATTAPGNVSFTAWVALLATPLATLGTAIDSIAVDIEQFNNDIPNTESQNVSLD